MKEANTFDLSLLILLAVIWGSSFFNIKIATYSYDPITLALVRVIFASIPLLILCKMKGIKIEAFSENWNWYALIGLCNIAIPFVLIAIGTSKINSYLAAILMSTTPLSGSILAHFFTKDEKLSYLKSLGVLIGFSGIVLLFFDKVIINSENYIYALITILGSTFYCIGGLLTLKLKNKKNENVTTSTTLWSVIFLLPFSLVLETPWESSPYFNFYFIAIIFRCNCNRFCLVNKVSNLNGKWFSFSNSSSVFNSNFWHNIWLLFDG
jgi:drug/metabolite transporter (DMT)-like permease